MKLTASNSDLHIHPMAHGPIVTTEGILPMVATGKKIISLEPSTGSVKWLRVSNTLGPVGGSTGFRSEEPRIDMIAATPQGWAFTPQVVVSPNGKYLAIRIHSYLDPEGSENIGDQCVGITVLNAETGETVRTVETSGLVLGQALTNDSLAAETAQNYYPVGTGVINVPSLSKAQAGLTSFRSDQWLIGASPESLPMSQELPSHDSPGASWPHAITRINIAGEELGTVTGVRGLHSEGWVDHFKDLDAVAEIANSQSDAFERAEVLEAPQHELFHVDTGTILDAANLLVADIVSPTGSGILLYTQHTENEEEKTIIYPTPVSWLDTTDGRNSLNQEKTTQILYHASQHVWNDGFFPSLTTPTPRVGTPSGSLPLPKEQ